MKQLTFVFLFMLIGMAEVHPLFAIPAQAKANEQRIYVLTRYADLADLALGAPIVADAMIRKASRLSEKKSPGIPTGHARFVVTATVKRLITSNRSLPANLSYLVDVRLDSRGKPPKLKGSHVFLFLKPSAGRSDQFVLSARNGQIGWSDEADKMIRAILTEAAEPKNQFQITGIGNAFYAPGTVPGESETQIFLTTADQRPVSLSILRRPGENSRWSVSLGEIVDELTKPADRNTLLWYRLACFLPAQMPESSLSGSSAADHDAIIADYAFVLKQLGPCGRQSSRT